MLRMFLHFYARTHNRLPGNLDFLQIKLWPARVSVDLYYLDSIDDIRLSIFD